MLKSLNWHTIEYRRNHSVLFFFFFYKIRNVLVHVDHHHIKEVSEYRDTSLTCLTETWLEHRYADGTVNVDHFSLVSNDRDLTSTHRGGGVAIYINERWCKNFTIKDTPCDDNLAYLTISCRPFYLPREFNCVYLTVAGGRKKQPHNFYQTVLVTLTTSSRRGQKCY